MVTVQYLQKHLKYDLGEAKPQLTKIRGQSPSSEKHKYGQGEEIF
jgi:hypothetical protein